MCGGESLVGRSPSLQAGLVAAGLCLLCCLLSARIPLLTSKQTTFLSVEQTTWKIMKRNTTPNKFIM